ncbi:MAG: replication initiation protein [Fusobacteriaceae bacterium]
MKLYCHSVLTNNKSQDNKLIKNACEKIVLNIFLKAQIEMKKEVEKLLINQYGGKELEDISRALFSGRVENFSFNLEVLKENLREKAVEKYSEIQELNLTKLAKENSINITRIREELQNLGGKWFVFNFINRKKIPKELRSRVVKEVNFVQTERGLFFRYQIPVPVLNFLVFPDQYSAIDMEIIKNLKFKYSIKFYLLVLDHKKRGILQLTKQELLESFSLPTSYSKDRNLFLNKFLLPTLKELKKVAKLKLTYDFKQDYSFYELELRIERNHNVFSKKILDKIEFAQRNIYIKKSWDKKAHDFLLDLYNDRGEEMVRKLLQNAYEKLNSPIKTTLANYFLLISKKIEVEMQKVKIETPLPPEILFSEDKKISGWEYYKSLTSSDQKIYENLARMLFEEKLGTKKYPEECFRAAFRSMINELIEME